MKVELQQRCDVCSSWSWCGRSCKNAPITKPTAIVTKPVTGVTKPVTDVCPTCGAKLRAMSGAERARRYRARQKAAAA
jgi:hypothetical protein